MVATHIADATNTAVLLNTTSSMRHQSKARAGVQRRVWVAHNVPTAAAAHKTQTQRRKPTNDTVIHDVAKQRFLMVLEGRGIPTPCVRKGPVQRCSCNCRLQT